MKILSKMIATSILFSSLGAYASIQSTDKLLDIGVDQLLQNIEDSISSIDSPNKCAEEFKTLYQVLYNFDSRDAKLPEISNEKLKEYTQHAFELRLKLKEKLKDLDIDHNSGKICLAQVKELTKALRYVEDYFIEYEYKRSGRMNNEFITFTGEGSHFLKDSDFDIADYNNLKTGDILISRGNAYSSAAIARISLDDYQFSHMTLVHRNQEGELYTSEAHIEIGSVVAPMQVHLDQKNVRTVLFRHKDTELAKRASEYTFNHIKDHKKNRGFNIEYDFGMELKNDKRLFCTEIAYIGYLNAAKEMYDTELKIPLHKTKFDKGHLRFLKQVGIAVNDDNIENFETFGPGDIQFDPRFEMVAEWRNPKKLQDTRFKDAILTKIFEWMDKENYYFKTRFGDKLKNSFAWLMRKNKWTASLLGLKEKFPLNMKVRQMNIFVNLDIVGEALYKELKTHQDQSETPLTFKELYDILEDFRIKDLAVYKKKKRKAKFHKSFHP